MADKRNRQHEKEVAINRVRDQQFAREQAANRLGISYNRVQASNIHHLASSKGYSAGGVKPPEQEVLDRILNKPEHKVDVSKFNIIQTVDNKNSWGNPAQYTGEVLDHVKMQVLTNKSYNMISLDTEWLGGGNFGTAAPVELGIIPVTIRGTDVIADSTYKTTFAIELPQEEADRIRKLIERVDKSYAQGQQPVLTDDEFRTLKDLVNYSGDDSINVEGLVTRNSKKAIMDKQSLALYMDDIRDGFSRLDPSSKEVNPHRAIKRANLQDTIAKKMMKPGGWKLSDDTTYLWHNGLAADVPVWEKSFGQPVNQIFGLGKNAKHLDSLSILRSVEPNALQKYLGYKGNISAPDSLEMLSKRLGINYAAHVAGDDAWAGAQLLGEILKGKNGKLGFDPIIDRSRDIIKGGTSLFSVDGITRGENPLDWVLDKADDGSWKPRDYQNLSVYKNAEHKIESAFEYGYSGKQYYGVVLHNVDDDVRSIIARDNILDLQNTIQSNFVNMSSVAGGMEHKALRSYVKDTRARREYGNMFRGKDAYRNFNRYVNAARTMKSAGGMTKSGLVAARKSGLTRGQLAKLARMYPRLESELDLMTDLQGKIRGMSSDQQSVALHMFKQELDASAGHFIDVNLPSVYKQARIFDPGLGKHGGFRTVNARSSDKLAMSLYNIATDTGGNGKFNFADAKYRLKSMVSYMGDSRNANNRINIGVANAEKLAKMIDRVAPTEGMRGIHDISSFIASNIIDELPIDQTIDSQEALTARAAPLLKEAIDTDSITVRATKYFKLEDSLAVIDPSLENKLSEVDDYLLRHVSQYADIKNPKMGPTKIMDNIRQMARAYSYKDVGMEIRLAESEKPGLIMTLFDMKTAKNVTNRGAEVFIPLVNTAGSKAGLIETGGILNVNILRPKVDYKTGSIGHLDTYQNKLFESLTWGSSVDEISALVASGDLSGAASKARNKMSYAMEGIPSGARYNIEGLKEDFVASTKRANFIRQGYIDMNDLLYGILGTSDIDENLKRMILYPDTVRNRLGIPLDQRAAKVLGVMEQLGLRFDTSAVKGERLQAGFVNAKSVNPKQFGVFGWYNDTGRENLKAAQNYYEMKMDDIIRTSVDGSYTTRGDILSRFSPEMQNRLVNPLVATDAYLNTATPGIIDQINLNTAFVTDLDIQKMIKENGIDPNDVPFLQRLRVHDDMMVMRSDVAELFGVMQQKVVTLDPGMTAEKLTIGELARKGVTKLDDSGKFLYGDKYDAFIRGVQYNESKGAYEVILDQVIGAKAGMKVMGSQSGNKFTPEIALANADEWNSIVKQMGPGFSSIEAMVKADVSKLPGDTLASQFALLSNELSSQVTLGKITIAEMRATAQDVLANMFTGGKGRAGLKDKAQKALVDAVKVDTLTSGTRALVMPQIHGQIDTAQLFASVGNILSKYGSSNIVGQGVKGPIYRGMMAFSRTNVDDWTKVGGKDAGIASVGLRELEFIYNRSHLIGTDINGILGSLESKIFENGSTFSKEGNQFLDVLRSASNNNISRESKIPVVRTRGAKHIPEGDKAFSEIHALRNASAYSEADFVGTILDPKLFNGQAFFMELPEKVTIGDFEIEKLLMPSLHLRGENGVFHPSGVAMEQRKLYESIAQYRNTIAGGASAVEKASAHEALTNSVYNYLTEVGDSIRYSKGYIADNALSMKLPHSGHFNYRAVNPMDYLEEAGINIGNKLEEGHALISRKDFAGMLKGTNSKDAKAAFTAAENMGTGFNGIGIRYPTKEFDSLLPMKINVMSKEQEKAIIDKYGYNPFEGNIYLTLGDQIRHGADHDGDRMALFMPQMAGKKVSFIQKNVNEQLTNWFEKEVGFTKKVAEYARGALKESSIEISKVLSDTMNPSFIDSVTEVESRLMKKVGMFSNINTVYRRMAETVGSATTAATISGKSAYQIMNFFGTAVEQAPISYKKIKDMIERNIAEAGEKMTRGQAEEMAVRTYIKSSQGLYDSMRSADINGIIENAKGMGFIDKAGDFIGATKNEGARAAIELGLGEGYGLGGKVLSGRMMNETDIRQALQMMMDNVPGLQDQSPTAIARRRNVVGSDWFNIGLKKLGGDTAYETALNALEMGNALANPNAGNSYSYYALNTILGKGLGDKNLAEEVMKTAEQSKARNAGNVLNEYLLKGIGGEIGDTVLGPSGSGAETHTVGDAAVNAVKKSVSAAFADTKLGGIALAGGAVLAGWSLSAFARGPNIEQETVQARKDRAPSSDGSYVDPSIYAGAPEGAGPTAYLAQKGSGYERVNVKISGNALGGLTNDEVANTISEEIRRQTALQLNISITNQDNREDIDKQWLQQQFANALKTGYVY